MGRITELHTPTRMITISSEFGVAVTGIGYRFFGVDGAWIGERVTDGISNPRTGVYLSFAEIPANAAGVVWDSGDGSMTATEGFAVKSVPPAPGADPSMCRVYGYFSTPEDNAVTADVTFELASPAPTAGGKIVVTRTVTAKVDAEGRLSDSAGNPWVDLQRNDSLTPSGSLYLVTCKQAYLNRVPLILSAESFDLLTLATKA